MEKATIIMLLAAIVLPALSQAQTTNICDRTPKVRGEILQRLELEADDCATVDSGTLASVDVLTPAGLTALQAGDFDGLTGLQQLALHKNRLAALTPP